ncbi:Phosphoglycolate phosphatase, HAD superfamily [Streptoalloteichus tenebrarius]|uniref:Phosphoglycolate phosphatase, HAD superfamily n=1 Tax=Streptoalloteichus tenebrarius (strain ATCC 17920 / DSM 40477 / JCM 4838 / CBS 697.72 / NBRC 16177 / NCIMB 11028 / NRRL B-12390 / A12253. 1 / ISP 5477) TaxID=1933 RepID=A0ABT1HMN2_STRSD|nr:HAD hydrolase-like protein [Streptoalloteichus tenebrarius]MCP2256760.1 Phosphoglycolate phosphatase, HAD superfamily [Streptoalloteichus tenebrarius]BFF00335.1 HAD hydrolase-like protein [Streptoalloteichus tenebrarius]
MAGGLARGARHVVWDWNGTLLDDNHAVLAGVNEICRSYGREPLTLDEWRAVFSRPLLACYERVLNRSLTLDEWADLDRRYHDTYRGLLSTCGLATGVPDLLREWAAAGGSQSLLSLWFHDELVPLVSELGLADLFARIDGLRVDVGGGSKAEHLVEHLAALRIDPADVVLIGDVADDAHAAQQAGARCVLVSTGMMSRSSLLATGVPVADSVAEALALVQGERAA